MRNVIGLLVLLTIIGFWIGVFEFNSTTNKFSYHPEQTSTFMDKVQTSVKDLTGFDTSNVGKEVQKVSKQIKN